MVAPIIFMFFLAAIEFTRLHFVRNSAAVAAYEGARVAMVAGGNISKGIEAARKTLKELGIDKDVEVKGTMYLRIVQMEINVPMDKNSWGVSIFTRNSKIRHVVRLRRETPSVDWQQQMSGAK
jgi:hypothetical protein